MNVPLGGFMGVRLHHATSPLPRRGRGVLVVEADPEALEVITLELKPLDVDVTVARTGTEAISLLRHGAPAEVLITDMQMPGMDGVELIQRLRSEASFATLYMVMLTANETVDNCTALGRGADDYLAKPYAPQELRAVVRAGLRARAHHRTMVRRERRRAIEWLANVVSHELNNPLAAALCGADGILGLCKDVGDGAFTAHDRDELRAMAEEMRQVLLRMKEVSRRLTRDVITLPSGHHECVNLDSWLRELEALAAPLVGGALVVRADKRSASQACINRALLLGTTRLVLGAAGPRCTGDVEILVHFDAYRVAVVLELEGAPQTDPEIILEPRLTEGGDGPPTFDTGLSGVEAAFARHGGQIFARPLEGRWRFGLTLPIEVGDVAMGLASLRDVS